MTSEGPATGRSPSDHQGSLAGEGEPRGRLVALGLLFVCAVAGAVTLVVELCAVRLLAPWYGASTRVWTDIIAAILGALALGYLLGARWSSARAPLSVASACLAVSSVLCACLPGLGPCVAAWFMPQGLRLEQAYELGTLGALASALILFAPPACLLAAVGPLAGEELSRRRRLSSGAAAGRVLCASTLGSLIGAFSTTHALAPSLGLTRTFVGAGAVLFLLALCVRWLDRGGARGRGGLAPQRAARLLWLVAWAALGTALWRSRWNPPAVRAPLTLLEQRNSPYQFVRVVEDHSVEPAWRLLQVNEGLDSFQSVWAPEAGLLGQGFYYDYFALPAWLEAASGPWRVLVLGLGGGTAFRVLAHASPPQAQVDLWGVEIDPVMIELGRRWMDLGRYERPGQCFVGMDARLALRSLEGPFDLIVLDSYAHQVEIPAHLMSVEFAREIRARLRPGGWLLVNAGGFGVDDPVVRAVRATLAVGFEQECVALRVPRARNWVVGVRREADWPAEWAPQGQIAAALLEPLRLPGAVVRSRAPAFAAAEVLRDDQNDMELRQIRSLRAGWKRDG